LKTGNGLSFVFGLIAYETFLEDSANASEIQENVFVH